MCISGASLTPEYGLEWTHDIFLGGFSWLDVCISPYLANPIAGFVGINFYVISFFHSVSLFICMF